MRPASITHRLLMWLCLALPMTSCAAVFPELQHIDTFDHAPVVPMGTPYPVGSCSNELPVDQRGVQLDVQHLMQENGYTPITKSNLCWATCLSMVSTYLGNPRLPCQVASYQARDGLSCCRLSMQSPPEDIARCDHGSSTGEHARDMGMYLLESFGPLSEWDIRKELANGHPIVMSIRVKTVLAENDPDKWPGHEMVISGFTPKTYHVLNPNRATPDDLTYEQLLHGDLSQTPKPHGEIWTWRKTWYHLSYRQDGCNPRFNPYCSCSNQTVVFSQ